MKRRTFIKNGGVAAATLSTVSVRSAGAVARIPESKMKRLGCTSVCFRGWYAQTRAKDAPANTPTLQLLDTPKLFAERLGVHNVEVWSKHFDEYSMAYCGKLQKAAAEAGSNIINVQLDEPGYNLSNTDAVEKTKSINFVKEWMDRAAACGATSLRANTGGTAKTPFNLDVTADSFHQLAEYGETISVKILIENHGGHSSVPENVVAIVEAVNSPYCRTLPDFGNIPKDADEAVRYDMLKKLYPHAHLVSAKGMIFDEQLKHVTYDIGACVRIGEELGFKGIYSAEQWAPGMAPEDPFVLTRRILELVAEAME